MNRKEIDEIESFLKQLSEETDFEFELKLIKDWTELHIIVDYKRPEFGPSGWRLTRRGPRSGISPRPRHRRGRWCRKRPASPAGTAGSRR